MDQSPAWIVDCRTSPGGPPQAPQPPSPFGRSLHLEGPRHAPGLFSRILPTPRLCGMPSPEEYGQRAKKARDQADACRNEWERQGLLIIADQYERLAAYKNLTAR